MNLDPGLEKLGKIYDLHDRYMNGFEFACGKKCDACCTNNLAITTLEGQAIRRYLKTSNTHNGEFLNKLSMQAKEKHYIPKATINQIAEYCKMGVDLPEEENEPSGGVCPFLEDNLCVVYEARPLGCRALVSKKDCRKTGFADMDEIILNINNLFMQFAEELDAGGFTGNMLDIIPFLNDNSVSFDQKIQEHAEYSGKLQPNRRIPVLMIPEQEYKKIKPTLKSLIAIIKGASQDSS